MKQNLMLHIYTKSSLNLNIHCYIINNTIVIIIKKKMHDGSIMNYKQRLFHLSSILLLLKMCKCTQQQLFKTKVR